ncbi:hypothetical protein [Streptomyces sp. NPDC006267]|uniref:zinc finger domain-containing protein n=1 Tax=Streptomyces sp. NPDC006267 TaxID=3157173 RepID=UPI0033A6E3E7
MNTQPDQCRTAESACGRQCLDLEGHDGDHMYERSRTVPQPADIQPAAFAVSSEEAAANVTAAVPVLAASGLPAAEACTDPRHTGPIRAQLGCTGPDPAGTVPRTERAYWQDIADALNAAEAAGMSVGIELDGTLTDHRAWSVVWDRDAERWTLAGYDDEDQEQPPAALLDPFAEAAIRHSALLCGALAIEALPQDFECDPGRGDSVKLLRRLAGLTTTTEQPTGLTWEARADHAVRLYATTAIELEDARAELAKLRDERDEARRDADRYAARIDTARALHTRRADSPHCEHDAEQWPCPTVAALDRDDQAGTAAPFTAAELEQGQADADALAAEFPDTIASLADEIADDIPHRRAPQIAADYLARHARLLAAEAHTHTSQRSKEMHAEGYRGRVAWCSGMREVARLLDARADTLAPQAAAPAPQAAAEEQPHEPHTFPQLAVPCPRCESPVGVLCTSHNGTRQRTSDTHQDRTRAYRATQAGR